jgi:hypothetical protein
VISPDARHINCTLLSLARIPLRCGLFHVRLVYVASDHAAVRRYCYVTLCIFHDALIANCRFHSRAPSRRGLFAAFKAAAGHMIRRMRQLG